MIKFEKVKKVMKNYVMDSDIYDVDDGGYLMDEERIIDYDELLTQMVYSGKITSDEAAVEQQNYKEVI